MKRLSLAFLLMAGLVTQSVEAATDSHRIDAAISDSHAATLSDPVQAIVKAEVVRRLAQEESGRVREIGLATSDWLVAEANLRLNKPTLALPAAKSAEARLARIGDTSKLRGDVLVTLGWQAMQTGQAAQALMRYQAAHEIFRRVHDDRSRARALVAIAILYDEAFDHTNALRYLTQAKDAVTNDLTLTLSIDGNIGQTLKALHRYPDALQQTRRALAIAHSINNQTLVGHVLRNLARIELLTGDIDAADGDIARAFHLMQTDDVERGALLATAAQAALQHGRVSQAVSLIGRSFDGVDTSHTPLGMRERHQTAYDIYLAAGDSPHALLHLAAMKRLDDEATRLATSTNTALMGARFDFANQELRIAKLKAQEAARTLTFERARARTQSWIFVGVISVIAVVVALLIVGLSKLRRSRNEVARANIVLAETNIALGKALAAKTEFLATTSHEIRTPLNGILGMTQVMLADSRMDQTVRERIDIVHAAGLTMRALVNDILDVAKMENGHLTVENAPLDLCATLGELVKLWREQAQAKGLAFEADLTNCPAHVEGDVARLRQVVSNLLGNAIKFTETGTVSLRAWRVSGDTPRYRVSVTDTGIGVAADKYGLIFESFQQGDTSTTRRFGGTGLGLAISRRLARAMGGDVTVSSEPGSGSVFILELPLVDATPETSAEAARGDALLVIERNPIARGMFKALLSARYSEIVFAGSAAEAATLIEAGGVAWVLADDATLRLEGSLDEQVAIVATAAQRHGAPVALLWSKAGDEDDERLVRLGAQHIMRKPIMRNALSTKLFDDLHQPANDLECRAA